MNEEMDALMDGAITKCFEEALKLPAGSKERSSAIEDLTKLLHTKLDDSKNNWEYGEKYERRVMEEKHNEDDVRIKEKQVSEQKKDRIGKWVIAASGISLNVLLYVAWMAFEKNGNIAPRSLNDILREIRRFSSK